MKNATDTAETPNPPSTDNGKGLIHLSLQGKGGVGKSLIASLLAQFHMGRGDNVRCVDTDPVNQTLSQYAALKAQHLHLMDNGRIDQHG